LGFLTNRVAEKFNNNASFDDFIRAWSSGTDYTGGNDVVVNSYTAMKYSAYNACLRILAETLPSAPIKEYRKTSDGGRQETNDTGLYDVLHNAPNDEMDSFTFFGMASNQINTGGYVVCSRVLNRAGQTIGLYPHEWQDVSITRDPTDMKLRYAIKGQEVKARPQVFHVNGPSMNGVVGMSPLEYMASAIRLGMTYEKFSTNFYKNGAMPTGVFEHPSFMKKEAYDRLKEDLDKNHGGMVNAGKPILLEDGMKYQAVTMKLSDAELLASKRFQIEDVARFLRIPLHMVNSLEQATNNNIEHLSLGFIMYTMLPNWKRWEGAINTQLLTRKQRDAGYYFEFQIAGLLRGDSKSMAESFSIGRLGGWLSVNDIRRLLNMNPIANGDVYLQPMNYQEAGTQAPDQKNQIVDELYKLIESSKK